jgi:aspartate aminotransferase
MGKPYAKLARQVTASTTLAIDSAYKQMLAEGQDVVGFGTGEPDFNTPDDIKQAGIAAIENNFTRYTPAAGTEELRKAVCDYTYADIGVQYQPNQVVVSSGAKHNIFLALACLVDPGDEVILPAPYWVSYPEQIAMVGGAAKIVNGDAANGFAPDVNDIAAAITPKTKAIIINSPSNPTGMVIDREKLSAIAALCVKHGIYILSDEIYTKLVYDGITAASVPALGEDVKELTVLISGVSKSYAMTGWRIGYACANKELTSLMANYQSHSTSSPSTVSQKAAVAALRGDGAGVEQMRRVFEKRRNLFLELAKDIPGIHCVKPQGAFYIMMSMSGLAGKTLYGHQIKNADDFAGLLLDKAKVAVVPCSGFGAPDYMRWSYAVAEANIEKGLSRLKTFIENGLAQ